MAENPKPDAQEAEETKGGVKSYAAPERTGPGVGRIVTFLVIAVVIALLLFWLL